jgi:hypothetical protein
VRFSPLRSVRIFFSALKFAQASPAWKKPRDFDLSDALFGRASALADREFSLAVQDKDSSGQTFKQPSSWVLDEQRITQAVPQLVLNVVSHTTQGQEIRITIS